MYAKISELKQFSNDSRIRLFLIKELAAGGYMVTAFLDKQPTVVFIESPVSTHLAFTLEVTRPTKHDQKRERIFSSLDSAFSCLSTIDRHIPVLLQPYGCFDMICHA